jgi:hypothetical protein
MGNVAAKQNDWAEAERCYREGLAIAELQGDIAAAATICNQLSIVARNTNHSNEAEGWLKRALEHLERLRPCSSEHALALNNLASLLVSEMRKGYTPKIRLNTARSYAQQALDIEEGLDVSSAPVIWATLEILSEIANLAGLFEEARNYHYRANETCAAFVGNREQIDREFGPLIANIAAAARGNARAQEEVITVLSDIEGSTLDFAVPIRRILAGERDWHSLTADLKPLNALLILRVLETIEDPKELQKIMPEDIIASLPSHFGKALESGDDSAIARAFEDLSPAEKDKVVDAISYLRVLDEEINETDAPTVASVLQRFEPLLQKIALVAVGNEGERELVEEMLADLETKGWKIREPVQHIWAGERDEKKLAIGLNDQDILLLERVLEIIAVEESKAILQSLARAIATVARGEITERSEIEDILTEMETNGWQLKEAIERIWAGERDALALTKELDEPETNLVKYILGIIVGE